MSRMQYVARAQQSAGLPDLNESRSLDEEICPAAGILQIALIRTP